MVLWGGVRLSQDQKHPEEVVLSRLAPCDFVEYSVSDGSVSPQLEGFKGAWRCHVYQDRHRN